MNMTTTAKWLFLIAGGYALLCAPAILVAERYGWSEAPLHSTQLLATLICFVSSAAFMLSTTGSSSGWERSLSAVALILSGLWLAFFCYVILTFDLSGID